VLKFSIIIPTLDEEKSLPQLLVSLSKQSQKDFEVIVSDGHSEDKTKERALAFQDSLDLKFIESPKKKVTFQRNYGAKSSKGEYLIFLDADYQADENFVAVLSQAVASSNADIVIPISMPLTKSIFWRTYYAIANKGSFLTLILRRPFVVASAICVKKEMFEKLGGYDDSIYIYEDQYLIQQLFKIGAKIVYTKARVHFLARRQERDGKVKFISQNIISTLYLIFKGPIKKEIFRYKMGGHEFKTSK
jgi:glycosyltransferase involved in cell wall biosynthesis